MSILTTNQKKAVETVDRNVCVSAGAGTGKTRVLVERFIYLIEHSLARCGEILAITFTEKAAQEMKARIARELGARGLEEARRELENAYIGTIHSFCARILREHPVEAGVDPDFRVLEEDRANLLQAAVQDDLIESRFQEPAMFDLLRLYSEQTIKKAIQSVTEKVHTFGSSILEIASSSPGLHPRNDGITDVIARQHAIAAPTCPPVVWRKQSQDIVLRALEALRHLKGREFDGAEIEAAIEKPVGHWDEVEILRQIGKRFRRQKTKPETAAFKDALEEFIADQAESFGRSTREAFLDLAGDFETRYRQRKRECSSLDFNDLEREAVRLLAGSKPRSAACRNLYHTRFKFVMIDEFQDTSPLQDQLITLVARPDNLFVVGDWKQSIYGFRGAEASLFLEKEKTFLAEGTGERIPLVENFRSRARLLNQLNSFFQHLWASEDRTFEPLEASHAVIARQHAIAADKSPSPGARACNDGCVELLTIEREEDETVEEVRMKEARTLAERIRDLVNSGAYEYGDIAMLFRVATDIYFYEHELKNLGIPFYVVSGRGFYKQPEVRDLIAFLELLENPHLDIPLASVLRSPLVQISDDTLLWLAKAAKRAAPSMPFYDALLKLDEIAEIRGEDRAKLKNFRAFFFELLEQKEKWTVSECLELILERTKYDRYVLGLPQGKRHFANLRKLLEIAREVEGREPIHLGDFIRYVKGLELQEVRESEAQVEALEGNVVKLMTIHKAKGLEFKVVLIPDLNRKGEKRRAPFLLDSEYGLGFKVFNETNRKFEETLAYKKAKEKMVRDALEESKRLLYVGMTRAKDLLILSGSSEESGEEGEEGDFDDQANWYAWIRGWLDSREGDGCEHKIVKEHMERKGRLPSPLAQHKRIRTALERHEPIRVRVPESAHRIIESLKPITPVYFERLDLPVTAYSVFQSDPELYRKTYELGVLPHEAVKDEEWRVDEDEAHISGADFGTLIHGVFESLVSRPDKARTRLDEILKRVAGGLENRVFEEVKDLSNQFLSSPVFGEIKSATARYAEIPFVLRLHSGIVQGTLDLLYQDRSGGWIILDYKTDRISERHCEAGSPRMGRSSPADVILRPEGPKDPVLDSSAMPGALPQNDDAFAAASTLSGAHPRNDGGIAEQAQRYRSQLMLYALASHELLHLPLKCARLYFARPNETFDFDLGKMDYGMLRCEFEDLQKQIIAQRKAWLR